MECVPTPTYSISINGNHLYGFFNGKRVIRQGNPLSPYLFVISMEYLSRMIKNSIADPNFNVHPKCSKLGITHLAFVDDLILFSRGDSAVRSFMCTLQFGSVSGLHINLSKSRIFTTGVSNEEFSVLHNISQFPQGVFPVRYLGVLLTHGKFKSSHFAPLIEKNSGRIR